MSLVLTSCPHLTMYLAVPPSLSCFFPNPGLKLTVVKLSLSLGGTVSFSNSPPRLNADTAVTAVAGTLVSRDACRWLGGTCLNSGSQIGELNA